MSEGPRKGQEPIVPLKGEDAFWLTDLYPDAKALFEHDHANLTDVSGDCIVVLDANVLLLPFEFSTASVDEVERVYTELAKAGRLVVPGQAAREFYKHRSRKIAAIVEAIESAIGRANKQIFEKTIPLLEDDEDYQAARELGKDFVNKGKEIARKLTAINQKLQDEIGADRVSVLYRKLLGKCVAEVEIATEDRKAVVEEVARRARLQIAPGFKDQQKEDGGIGDYLVWRAILQEGERRKAHCIFVTEEQKADWWIKRHGAFQPRPELIDEYRRNSGGKSLHLLPLSALLSNYKATAAAVNEVQEVEGKRRKRDFVLKNAAIDGYSNYIQKILMDDGNSLSALVDRVREVDEEIARLKSIKSEGGIDDDMAHHLFNLGLERDRLVMEIGEASERGSGFFKWIENDNANVKRWLTGISSNDKS